MTALTPLLAPDAAYDPGAQQRTDMRSNMFVTAVLYADGGSVPIRIRNMSRGGALIESAIIPPEASQVRLSRGSLSVGGHIAWRRDNRAGIRFDAAVEVANWLPRGNKPTEQQRVDELIQACRSETSQGGERTSPKSAAGQAEIVRHLREYRDTLNAVAEELAGCVAIAKTYPIALQKIDVTAQMLEKLAARLAGRN